MLRMDERIEDAYLPQIAMLRSIAAAKPSIAAKIAAIAVTNLVW